MRANFLCNHKICKNAKIPLILWMLKRLLTSWSIFFSPSLLNVNSFIKKIVSLQHILTLDWCMLHSLLIINVCKYVQKYENMFANTAWIMCLLAGWHIIKIIFNIHSCYDFMPHKIYWHLHISLHFWWSEIKCL